MTQWGATLVIKIRERERERPIHMASAANVTAAETLGDELLKV